MLRYGVFAALLVAPIVAHANVPSREVPKPQQPDKHLTTKGHVVECGPTDAMSKKFMSAGYHTVFAGDVSGPGSSILLVLVNDQGSWVTLVWTSDTTCVVGIGSQANINPTKAPPAIPSTPEDDPWGHSGNHDEPPAPKLIVPN